MTASIKSQTVVVSGVVTGNIDASRQVVLHKTAQIEGDVSTPSLVVEEGAQLNGTLTMKGGKGGKQAPASNPSGGSGGQQGGPQN